jgi:hypothetical protein
LHRSTLITNDVPSSTTRLVGVDESQNICDEDGTLG